MRRGLLLSALLLGATTSLAQDALRGKRLYLDAPRVVGSAAACVDCHGGLPGGAFGIGRAAGDPAAVERAVNAIPQMSGFRGRLASQDYADLAAFIGNAAVASPDVRVTTTAPAGGSSGADRIDFGPVTAGTASAVATARIVNLGQVGFRLASTPRLRGAHAADFAIVASECADNATLAAQQGCRIDIVFRPPVADGLRTASLQIDHDWVGGTAALALLGSAGSVAPAPPPAPPPAAGGGGVLPLWTVALLAAAGMRRPRDVRFPASLSRCGRRC